MKKNVMKLLSLVLVLALVLGLGGTSVYAEGDTGAQENTEGSEEASGGEVVIVEEEEEEDIPETIDPQAVPEERDPLNVKEDTIASNVYILGESLSGMGYQEAYEFCDQILERFRSTEFILQSQLEEGKVLVSTYKDFGVSWDVGNLTIDLKKEVQKGNILERYKKAKDLELDPVALDPKVHCDEETALEYFYTATADWNRNPENAKVNVDHGSIQVTEGSDGYAFDCTDGVKELVRDINSYNIPGSSEYEIPIYEEILHPEFTSEQANQFTIIGSATTEYPSPTTTALQNRVQNLRQSTANMSGRTFAPGEEISALDLYGNISIEGGYAEAGTISAGSHVKEVGGGICQTTTTLYNAVLAAELDVVYRKNHSMLILYVDPSRDAMVYAAGGSDFKFKNSSSDYIIIDAYINEPAETITVNIIGHEDHPADHSVRYESEILEITVPPITVNEDPSIPLGWSNVGQKIRLATEDGPTVGIKSRLWKITTDGGVETRTLFSGTDTYAPGTATYVRSSDANVTLSATGPRNAGYLTLNVTFLDGTPLATDPALQTKEWRVNFNNTMRSKLGSRWPYTNDGYKDSEPSGSSEKKEKSKDSDKKDSDKKEEEKED